MNKIINFCIQHVLTDEQLSAGLYNPVLTENELMELKNLMSVSPMASSEDVREQAHKLYDLIYKVCIRENTPNIHIMGHFELIHYLIGWNLKQPYINNMLNVYQSVTDRVSIDVVNPDGSITKTSKFVFKGLRQIIN